MSHHGGKSRATACYTELHRTHMYSKCICVCERESDCVSSTLSPSSNKYNIPAAAGTGKIRVGSIEFTCATSNKRRGPDGGGEIKMHSLFILKY